MRETNRLSGVGAHLYRRFAALVTTVVSSAVLLLLGTSGVATAEPFPCGGRGTCAENLIELNVRLGPSLSEPVMSRAPQGKWMALHCWTYGDVIHGDSVWYHITWVSSFDGHSGYVAGYYMDTGPDPAPGIPRC